MDTYEPDAEKDIKNTWKFQGLTNFKWVVTENEHWNKWKLYICWEICEIYNLLKNLKLRLCWIIAVVKWFCLEEETIYKINEMFWWGGLVWV